MIGILGVDIWSLLGRCSVPWFLKPSLDLRNVSCLWFLSRVWSCMPVVTQGHREGLEKSLKMAVGKN